MVITFTVSLKGHDPLLSFRADRADVFKWVCNHVADIDSMELDCGWNRWSWSPTMGWVQYPQFKYVPGSGVIPANCKPIRHGNGYDARHPWRFCDALPIPNPMCSIPDDALF